MKQHCTEFFFTYIKKMALLLLSICVLTGCSSKKYESEYTQLFDKIGEITQLADEISPTTLSLWDKVGPNYLTGVLSLMLTAESAEDLENPVFSNTKHQQYRLGSRIKFKGETVDNYYDILAVAMGYGSSYSTFRAGSAIPHDQTIKMFKTVEVYQQNYKGLKTKRDELESVMKNFRSQYKDKHSDEVGYLYDYYSEAISYADAVLSPSGSYITYKSEISDYKNQLVKLKNTADLY